MVRSGVWPEVEALADALIFPLPKIQDGDTVFDRSIISPHREQRWASLVDHIPSGIADPSSFRGAFKTARNTRQTWLNGHERGMVKPILNPGDPSDRDDYFN